MSDDELNARLKRALETRDALASEVARIQGRRDAAVANMDTVRAEIRAKNLDPDDLDQIVTNLRSAYEEELNKLERGLTEARASLAPYQQRVSGDGNV